MSRRNWVLAAVGVLVAAMLGVLLARGSGETPASPAVLNRIADKNEEAAINAAARFKAESQATTRAADARVDAADAAAAADSDTNLSVEP